MGRGPCRAFSVLCTRSCVTCRQDETDGIPCTGALRPEFRGAGRVRGGARAAGRRRTCAMRMWGGRCVLQGVGGRERIACTDAGAGWSSRTRQRQRETEPRHRFCVTRRGSRKPPPSVRQGLPPGVPDLGQDIRGLSVKCACRPDRCRLRRTKSGFPDIQR